MSAGLGEWDNNTPSGAGAPVKEQSGEGAASDIHGVLGGVDAASIAEGMVAATVAQEVRRQVQRQVAPIVAEAVAAVLTPERLDSLRTAAVNVAEAEMNPPSGVGGGEGEGEIPQLYYGSVDEFVREFVCPIFCRNVGEEGRADYRWSARWWESAEAITRLEAMWRSWEQLRLDAATGASVWLRDHADHHLGVLMSPTGPWALSKDTAGPDEPLPYEAPPEGLFPDVRDS